MHRSIIVWGYYSFTCTFSSSFSICARYQNQMCGNEGKIEEDEKKRLTIPM